MPHLLQPSSLGLRTKTAKAIAILLSGSAKAPQAIHRAELILSSPTIPATYQPYHAVMSLPWNDAQIFVQKSAAAIESLATQALASLLLDAKSRGFTVERISIVGAPERRLESIGSPHIRAHAAEGVLYRHSLEVAAAANGLQSTALVEKGFLARADADLGCPSGVFGATLARLGQEFGRPWRADEKMAAAAAWLALAGSVPHALTQKTESPPLPPPACPPRR